MTIILYTGVFIFQMIAAILEGIAQGFYYHTAINHAEVQKYNLHPMFVVQRGILVLFSGALIFTRSPLLCFFSITVFIFCFSFFHNGAYYMTRHELDSSKYPKGFKDNSTTSTSFFNFNYGTRLFHFVTGLALYFVGLYFIICAY